MLDPDLPIYPLLDDIEQTLSLGHQLVLEAPPGAGKTTQVPLALLAANWLEERRIIMLQPRRMAARNSAARMAELLGEPVGATVGYRVRGDSRVNKGGSRTRIEVVTEGVLTRMLQSDPALEGVGLLIFDEFHERSLDSDLGLALALQARELLREARDPLRVLVMSATLDGAAVADLLGGAPVLRSAGRQYPVSVEYRAPWRSDQSNIDRVVAEVETVVAEGSGSVLVFLPGQGEILRVLARLSLPVGVQVAPLYGALEARQQQQAIAAAREGERKVVLATNIAETSLTIDGISCVIDSGLERQSQYDQRTGMTRLKLVRISRAASVQRAGRAGRLGPGRCVRLWSEEQQQQLEPARPAEIRQADLAPLALQLLRWGVADPAELRWLDRPPEGPFAAALALLAKLGAATRSASGNWQISQHGQQMASLPLHPRLAHMLLTAAASGLGDVACNLAALFSERDPLASSDVDIMQRLALLSSTGKPERSLQGWVQRVRKQAASYRESLNQQDVTTAAESLAGSAAAGLLMAQAWPDRIARKIAAEEGRCLYQLANGRRVQLPADDPLAACEWLAVAETGGGVGNREDRVYLACELQPDLFDTELAYLLESREKVHWDTRAERLLAQSQVRVGKLVISSRPLTNVSAAARDQATCDFVRSRGLQLLSFSDEARQWQARIEMLRELEPSAWPNVSDAALLTNLEQWLPPWLNEVAKVTDLKKLDLATILASQLDWEQRQLLDRQLPEKIEVPSGSSYRLDYTCNPPVLAVKLQEMFGAENTPAVAGGRIPLMLHLLSPARRPLQVTQDLAGFWRGSYAEVRKEMKGRYPKHPWPEEPWTALPTRHTRHRRKA